MSLKIDKKPREKERLGKTLIELYNPLGIIPRGLGKALMLIQRIFVANQKKGRSHATQFTATCFITVRNIQFGGNYVVIARCALSSICTVMCCSP